eukprot:scaffold707_cov240-Pinguiococcus_pyrenoidosus.AAC.3
MSVPARLEGAGRLQHLLDFLRKLHPATMQCCEAGQIIWWKRVVPSRALDISVSPDARIEAWLEAADLGLRSHEARLRVEEAVPSFPCTVVERLALRGLVQLLGGLGGGEVREAKVQSEGHRIRHADVVWDVAQFAVVLVALLPPDPCALGEGILLDCLPRHLLVHMRNILDDCVRKRDVGEGAHHAVTVPRACPLRQPAALLEGVHPPLDDPASLVRVGEVQEGIHGAERVPESVVGDQRAWEGAAAARVRTPVDSLCLIRQVRLVQPPWEEQGAIQTGVEHREPSEVLLRHLARINHLDPPQVLVPYSLRLLRDVVKGPSSCLRRKVGLGVIGPK